MCIFATSILVKSLQFLGFSFLLHFDFVAKLNAGYTQQDGSNLSNTPLRRRLKRDYDPDTFKIPSHSELQSLTETLKFAYEQSTSVLSCPISTFSCGNLDLNSSYSSKSLGTCAIVASGQSLLRYKFGEEIDSYDTVLRIGFGPVNRFKSSVGSKTDVLFVRTSHSVLNDANLSIKRDYTGLPFIISDHLPRKFFIALPSSCQKRNFKGRSILKLKLLSHIECNEVPNCADDEEENRFKEWYGGFGTKDEFSNATESFLRHLRKFRKVGGIKSKPHDMVFTHGFELILAILHSNLCKTVTAYGFSKYPTYHYFDNPKKNIGRRVRPGHVMGMEYFILEQLGYSGVPIRMKASY